MRTGKNLGYLKCHTERPFQCLRKAARSFCGGVSWRVWEHRSFLFGCTHSIWSVSSQRLLGKRPYDSHKRGLETPLLTPKRSLSPSRVIFAARFNRGKTCLRWRLGVRLVGLYEFLGLA